MTLSVKQINALQPLEPPYHLHTTLIRPLSALSPPATVYGLYVALHTHL